MQCWRCHQLCSDSIPGSLFPRCDDILVQGYTLYRSKVFSDWERWNFIEIMLRYHTSFPFSSSFSVFLFICFIHNFSNISVIKDI